MSDHADEGGFALLEAVVALAVLAVVTAMFAGVMQSTALARRHSAQLREATLIARSELARATVAARADETGGVGRYRWTTRITAYQAPNEGAGLEQIEVRVAEKASGRDIVDLRTLRLAR